MKALGWMKDNALLLSMNQDIAGLKNRWKDDAEKTYLLETLAFAVEHLKNQSEILNQKDDTFPDRKNIATDSKAADKKKPGIWKKIKSIFTD